MGLVSSSLGNLFKYGHLLGQKENQELKKENKETRREKKKDKKKTKNPKCNESKKSSDFPSVVDG